MVCCSSLSMFMALQFFIYRNISHLLISFSTDGRSLLFYYLATFNVASRTVLVLDFWCTNVSISVQCVSRSGFAGL